MKELIELRKRLKQKYKRGFTLIELLAVIVILAIILIITIPNVLTSVNNTKKKSFASVSAIFKDSIKDYMEYASLGIGNGNNPALVELCGNDGSDCKGKAKYFTADIIQSFGYSTDDIDADNSYFTIDDKNNVSVCLKPEQSGKFAGIGNSDECNLLTGAIITSTAENLNTYNEDSGKSGLYQLIDITNENITYYYQGDVDNNYVLFGTYDTDIWYGYYSTTDHSLPIIYSTESDCKGASSYNKNCTKKASANDPIIWRIIRINKDGTIRLISELGVMSKPINNSFINFSYMYYSNGNSKGEAYYELDTLATSWYKNNLSRYEDKIATNTYCEAARVKIYTYYNSGNAEMQLYNEYKPTLSCEKDGNDKGVISSKIGLITYDEVVYAGGYFDQDNNSYYLNNNTFFWTMSPAGFSSNRAYEWYVNSSGSLKNGIINNTRYALRPVISLNSYTQLIGEGTIGDPYIVK